MVVESRFQQATTIIQVTNDGGRSPFSSDHHHQPSKNDGGGISISALHHHRYTLILKSPQQFRLQKKALPHHILEKPPRTRVASSTSRDSCNRRYSEATRRSERQADEVALPGRGEASDERTGRLFLDEAAFPNEEKRAANSRGRFAQQTELGHKRLGLLSLIPPIHPRWSRYTKSCLSAAYRW